MAAADPLRTLAAAQLGSQFSISKLFLVWEKAKPAERRGRKVTGPRFLREATEDLPKDPKIAGLPTLAFDCSRSTTALVTA